jgi:hypothetical protein
MEITMKYLQKSFSSGANTNLYRKNYNKVFPKVTIEIELPDEYIMEIEKFAKENNLSFDETINMMIDEGIDLLEEKERQLKNGNK